MAKKILIGLSLAVVVMLAVPLGLMAASVIRGESPKQLAEKEQLGELEAEPGGEEDTQTDVLKPVVQPDPGPMPPPPVVTAAEPAEDPPAEQETAPAAPAAQPPTEPPQQPEAAPAAPSQESAPQTASKVISMPAHEQPPAPAAEPAAPPAVEVPPQSVSETPATEVPPAEKAAQEPPRYTADMTVEEIRARMTLDEAKAIIVPLGSCAGLTLGRVAEERRASLKWYLYAKTDNIVKAGATMLMEELGMKKAG